MGYGIINTSTLTAIADAIREKLGVQTQYRPGEMSEAIASISGGGITPTGIKQINITANGTVTEDVTAYADAEISVNVPSVTPTGTKQVSITSNGTTTEDVTSYANAQISVNVVNQDYEDALVALGVTEDLTDGIEALTTYANGVTGESDTTLSDAVASLADGYGQGGGSFYSGTYTPEQDTAGPSFDVGAANISHFLIYATTDPRESGKKWFIYAHSNFNSNIVGIASNNTGISSVGSQYENNWFTKNGTVVTCASGVSGATTPGYFKAGVTYQWFAW